MAVEITPLPGAPRQVLGVIDVHGEIIPVIDPRVLFGMQTKALRLSDHFVIVDTGKRTVALLVDDIVGVNEWVASESLPVEDDEGRVEHFEAITRLDDSLVLIHDVEKFLSGDQALQLDRALAEAVSNAPSDSHA